VLSYFKDIVEKHEMLEYARLNHHVTEARWCESSGKWKIQVEPTDTSKGPLTGDGKIIINATGVLK
jgi:cation diffusion facilitator CzcD-associated flavoprotein CzcO